MPDLRERFRAPRAGWLSLGLLAVMALAVAWSVQGAAWLDELAFLAPVALWAVLFGAILGLVRWTIVVTLPLAAIIGAGFVIWTIGGEYFPELSSQLDRLMALRTELIDWTMIILQTGYPPQMSPYALGLGVLMWSTAFIASYVVYRHHRVIDAILLLGAALITNMSATFTDLFGHLLLFVIAALLLWLRASLVTRQDGWQRRRVNENLEVPAAIMRSGIVFAGASVALAWILTSVAVAAPLTGAWRSLDGVWSGVRDQFEGVFGSLTNPQSRITGNSFGPSFTVFGEWTSNDDEVLVLAAERPMYLRTVTYDEYTGRGWNRTDGPTRGVAAGDPLFPTQTSERPQVASSVELEVVAIEMRQAVGRNLFTPVSPLEIYAPSLVTEPNGLPLMGTLESPSPIGEGQSYEALIAVSHATEAELAAAGTNYPQAVIDLYTSQSGISDRVAQLAREVTAGAEKPYEQAKALAAYFNSSEFAYSTVGPVVPPDGDLVDTFLFAENGRSGYCQYFASAMALMARSLGLPARVAAGFSPGEDAGNGLWLAREANAHMWVEIYFPGYGWQIFEATKSVNPRFARESGTPTTAGPPDLAGIDPLLQNQVPIDQLDRGVTALPSAQPVAGAIDPTQPGAPVQPDRENRSNNLIVMATIVVAAVAAVWLRSRYVGRRWRRMPAGERAWRQLTLAADRAGVGPRPSETIYEYAGWLEDQLPKHVEPIRLVADGKVWQTYSGRRMTATASDRLDAAWAKLRLPLVGLAVRRWFRRMTRHNPS